MCPLHTGFERVIAQRYHSADFLGVILRLRVTNSGRADFPVGMERNVTIRPHLILQANEDVGAPGEGFHQQR